MSNRLIITFAALTLSICGATAQNPVPQGTALVVMHGANHTNPPQVGVYLVRTPSMDTLRIAGAQSINTAAGANVWAGTLSQATFSPDGRKVAFLLKRSMWDSPVDIWIVDNDGRNPRRAATMQDVVLYPDQGTLTYITRHSLRLGLDWAEDGYIYWGEGTRKIWRVNGEGGEPELVLEPQLAPDGEGPGEIYHLTMSNDGKYFGTYRYDTTTGRHAEPGFLIERSTGNWWRFNNNYIGISPDGSKLLEMRFTVGNWCWGARPILHSIPKVMATEFSEIDTLTAFGAVENPGDDHRINQLRFSSNSNDYFVAAGENGVNDGKAFLNRISDNQAWHIPHPAILRPQIISDWWMGELPDPSSTTVGSAQPPAVPAMHRAAAPMRIQAGMSFQYTGLARALRIIDMSGRTAGIVELDNTRTNHLVNWGSSNGAYWAVPVW